LVLVLPAAAHGAETTITVGNDFFQPANVQIAVGDTVNWVFSESGNHNVQSRAGEEESFDSDPGTPESLIRHEAGYKFSYTFNKDNVAVDYLCRVHPATMTGTVSVGSPPVDASPPAVTAARAKIEGRKVAISFKLDEAARVTVRIARASNVRRTLKTVSRRLGAGDRTIRVRRRGLRPGRYVAKLTAVDDAGNKSAVKRASFRLRPRRGG
jgi:plastocyanin